MSQEITKAHIQQYSSTLFMKYQQEGSKLRECVSFDGEIKGNFFYVDGIGNVVASKKTVRHEEHALTDTPHIRRQGALETWFVADMVDRADIVRILTNPTGAYLRKQANALGIRVDRIIIAAAQSDAKEGENGETTTPFPAGQTIAAGGTGLTVVKLAEASEKLNEANVPMENRYLAVSPRALSYALVHATLGSLDYNTQRTLMSGNADGVLGFNWRTSTELAKVGNIRDCLAWHKDTLVLGEPEGLFVDVGPVRTKHVDTQVYSSGNFAAVRRQDEGVVVIEVDESVALVEPS